MPDVVPQDVQDVEEPAGGAPAAMAAPGPVRTPGWIRRRARNVYRRPALVGAIAAGVAVVALVSVVVMPLQQQRAMRAAPARQRVKPDTVAIQRHVTGAMAAARAADSALARLRLEPGTTVVAPGAAAGADGDAGTAGDAGLDSVRSAIADLTRLLGRARNAPLPASYRALGESPALRGQRGVAALLDTLSRIEASRAAFGATGDVDPIFVALTSRATQVGKALQAIGEARRAALERELVRSTPLPLRPPDTVALARSRDSAAAALASARRWLAAAQAIDSAADAADARARAAASLGASIPAVLAGACVLGLVLGFGAALMMELRAPRVADRDEAMALTGVEALAAVGDEPLAVERRRQADRDMPPSIDLDSGAYRLAFAQLADRGDNLPALTVVGEDAWVTAVVAANLGATVALAARTVLVIDTDVEGHSLSRVTNVRRTPGLVDVLAGGDDWAGAVQSVVVGRGRTMDVLSSGAFGARGVLEEAGPELAAFLDRVRRRYECVVVSAPAGRLGGHVAGLPGGVGTLVTVRIGRTPHGVLRALAGQIRERGLQIRGLMLWDRGEPSLPAG